MNHTFVSKSVASQVASHEASKDGPEEPAWDTMKLFSTKPREEDPCKVVWEASLISTLQKFFMDSV